MFTSNQKSTVLMRLVFTTIWTVVIGQNSIFASSPTEHSETRVTVAMAYCVQLDFSLPVTDKNEQHFLKENILLIRNTQAAICTSPFVLKLASRDQNLSQLEIFGKRHDLSCWLQTHVTASFPQDSKMVQVKIVGDVGDTAEDLIEIMKAIKKAYLFEVIGENKRRLVMYISSLKACRSRYEESFTKLFLTVQSLEAKNNKDANNRAEFKLKSGELAAFEEVLHMLNVEISNQEANLQTSQLIQWFYDPMIINDDPSEVISPTQED